MTAPRISGRWLLLLAALLTASCQTETIEIETGYRGEARRNPFLAAQRLLEEDGWEVHHSASLSSVVQQSPDLLIVNRITLDDRPSRELVEARVRTGTHLLILAEGGESWRDDWFGEEPHFSGGSTPPESPPVPKSPPVSPGPAPQPPDPGFSQWLARFGLQLQPAERPQHTETAALGPRLRLDQPGTTTVISHPRPGQGQTLQHIDDQGTQSAPILASIPVGAGRLSVLAHARPLRSRYLAQADHARLLLLLAQQVPGSRALFLTHARVNLFALLWRHGWPALLGAAAALILFLWARMPRRQPIVQVREAGDFTSFRDQLVGTGNFLWQHGTPATLVAALRRHIIRRWRLHHPAPLATVIAISPETLTSSELQTLAAWAETETPQTLAHLLHNPPPHRKKDLQAQLRRLQKLAAKITHTKS